MNYLKKYKMFENDESFDTFDVIKEYIYEFCDILNIEIYPNDKREKIYSNTDTNGVLVWRFEDRYRRFERHDKTDEPFKYQTFIIDVRIKASIWRLGKNDKFFEMLSWLNERIDDLEVKISENLTMKFYARPQYISAPLFQLKFSLIKKVL